MGTYWVELVNTDGTGINKQRIFHNREICKAKNGGDCVDTVPEQSKLTDKGFASFTILGKEPSHYFYWNPVDPDGSGANSRKHFPGNLNEFKAIIIFKQ